MPGLLTQVLISDSQSKFLERLGSELLLLFTLHRKVFPWLAWLSVALASVGLLRRQFDASEFAGCRCPVIKTFHWDCSRCFQC